MIEFLKHFFCCQYVKNCVTAHRNLCVWLFLGNRDHLVTLCPLPIEQQLAGSEWWPLFLRRGGCSVFFYSPHLSLLPHAKCILPPDVLNSDLLRNDQTPAEGIGLYLFIENILFSIYDAPGLEDAAVNNTDKTPPLWSTQPGGGS